MNNDRYMPMTANIFMITAIHSGLVIHHQLQSMTSPTLSITNITKDVNVIMARFMLN